MQLVAKPISKGFREARAHGCRPESDRRVHTCGARVFTRHSPCQATVLLKGASPTLFANFRVARHPIGDPKVCRKGRVATWGHGNGRKAADGCRAGSVPRRPGWNLVPVAIPERRSSRVPSRSAREVSMERCREVDSRAVGRGATTLSTPPFSVEVDRDMVDPEANRQVARR